MEPGKPKFTNHSIAAQMHVDYNTHIIVGVGRCEVPSSSIPNEAIEFHVSIECCLVE